MGLLDPVQLQKQLSLIPTVEGISPFAKTKGLATEIRKLYTFLTIPLFTLPATGKSRKLVFQYNEVFPATVGNNWFLTNLDQFRGLAPWIIQGGCLTIKWRVGTTVSRYKLLDYNINTDWSYFPLYTNQAIGKNYCLEFWEDGNSGYTVVGISQPITFLTSNLTIPSTILDNDSVVTITNPPLLIANLGINLPEVLPYNQDNIVWNSN